MGQAAAIEISNSIIILLGLMKSRDRYFLISSFYAKVEFAL